MAYDNNIKEQLDRIEKKLGQATPHPHFFGYEYKSKMKIFGMPLVHIAQGVDPQTGKPRVAKGFIAIGNIAVGVFALGGISLGVFSFAGVGLGIVTFAGCAIGLGIAIGGLAVGTIAAGGLAVGYYALGGAAFGAHTISGSGADPQAVEFFKRFWPGIEKIYNR